MIEVYRIHNYIDLAFIIHLQGELTVYVWLLMCDEKSDNTLLDIFQNSSREVRRKSIYKIW